MSSRLIDQIRDYPFGPIVAALETILGRLFVMIAALAVGSIIGFLTATADWSGAIAGLIGFPVIALTSILHGIGIALFPITLAVTIAFVRCYWPLWIPFAIITPLMALNSHLTVDYVMNDSPSAKIQQMVDQAVEDMPSPSEETRATD